MATVEHSRITLELEVGKDPIRGSIEHTDGRRQPFWGWLELIDEVRRAAAMEPERSSPTTQASPEPAPKPDAQPKRHQPHTTTQEQP